MSKAIMLRMARDVGKHLALQALALDVIVTIILLYNRS